MKLLTQNKKTSLRFKIKHFKNTIQIIEKLDFKITDINQIKDIKGIGKGIQTRIEEILKTNTLKELKNIDFKNTSTNNIELTKLTSITGIGEVKAKDLLKKILH